MWSELLQRDVDINESLAAANRVSAWLLALATGTCPEFAVSQEEMALFLTFTAWSSQPFIKSYREEQRMLSRFGGEARG